MSMIYTFSLIKVKEFLHRMSTGRSRWPLVNTGKKLVNVVKERPLTQRLHSIRANAHAQIFWHPLSMLTSGGRPDTFDYTGINVIALAVGARAG